MSHQAWSRCILSVFVSTFLFSSNVSAQTNASTVLAQLSQAISGGNTVNSVTLSGNMTYYAGSKSDTGTATLYADLTGKNSAQLSLSNAGSHTEQTSSGPGVDCSWSGRDGVSHAANALNCWRPTAWVFPAISLQPSSILPVVGVTDLGTGTVGGSSYRHLQSQLVLSSLDLPLATQIMQESTMDLGLDSATLLPAVIVYSVRPDNGAPTFLSLQIQYSNYQAVSGVQIPFHIERRLNGALQYSFDVTTATTN